MRALMRMAFGAISVLILAGSVLRAQDTLGVDISPWIRVGSSSEEYLRYLQTLGLTSEYDFSLRPFTPSELRGLAPQAARYRSQLAADATSRSFRKRGARIDIAPVEVRTWFNTAFPFGMNDGAVWVGRGFTTDLSLGASISVGAIRATLRPTVFWAENRAFALETPPLGGASEFADNLAPGNVDRPQRFGRGPYARLDPGQSSLELTVGPMVAGVSSANQWWGPMAEFPYILGNNAPGFDHVFVGTSRSVDVFLGKLRSRILYGRLEQSSFSPETLSGGRRFVGGMVVVFRPRQITNVEVGVARFYHAHWPQEGLSSEHFTHLFEGFLKRGIGRVFAPDPTDPTTSTDNQMASGFVRWTVPRSGFELYGEYGREDHNADSRDAILEPDHAAILGLGARKAWGDGERVSAIRAEIINFQESTLRRHRAQGGTFKHGTVLQGHTNRGQLIAANVGIASGAGGSVAFDRFGESGRTTIRFLRMTQDRGLTVDSVDVLQSLRFERTVRVAQSPSFVRFAIDAAYQLNRNGGPDTFNARLEAGVTWLGWRRAAKEAAPNPERRQDGKNPD